MLEVPYLPPAVPGGDRSGRFIATGVILLIVALLSGCMTAFVPVAVFTQNRAAQNTAAVPRQAVPGRGTTNGRPLFASRSPARQPVSNLVIAGLMYVGVTVLAGWLGVGAFFKRRYVRPLVLILATHGILFGVLSIAMFALFMPMLVQELQRSMPPNSAAFAIIGLAISVVFMLVLFVGIPLTLLLLMKPDAVRQTAEHFDRRRRWTDDVPIKVLGLVLTLVVLAAFELMAVKQRGLPILYTTLTGPAFVIITLAHAVAIAWSAVLVYRRRMLGWHLAFYGLTIPTLLFCISSVTLPSEQYLALVDNQRDLVDLIREYETLFRAAWTAWGVIFLVATVVYLLRMRPLIEPPVATAVSE